MDEQQAPVAPLSEPDPQLHECLRDQQVSYIDEEGEFDPFANVDVSTVDIVRRHNPEQAYIIDRNIEETILDHPLPGLGRVFCAVRLPRLEYGVYLRPQTEESVERVAIKCLQINVVEAALRNGSRVQDPYKEINRMQTIGDNIHVLKCIEALKDEENLYIVTPYCERSLIDFPSLTETQALHVFSQILECLTYLRDHQICHRNLSPQSFLLYRGRVVLRGFTRSFQLPPWLSSVVIPDTHIHGKPAFQPPEVFSSSLYGVPYDVYQCDLWAAGMTFVYLLTGEVLYDFPTKTDLMFRCFILERGITGEINEGVQQCFHYADLWEEENVNEADRNERLRHAAHRRQARRLRPVFAIIQSLSPEVREILDYLLKVAPDERWNLDMVRPPTINLINRIGLQWMDEN